MQTFSIKFTGPAGAGLKSITRSLGQTLVSLGYYVFIYDEYPSIIKGGQASSQITISDQNINTSSETIDWLIDISNQDAPSLETVKERITHIQPSTQTLEFTSGNEAIAKAMLKATCKIYSFYPMSPATSISRYLQRDKDIIIHQAEDEIAAINIAIGANYTGQRAATATAGGGLCLMSESLALAGMTETPLVVINAMRPGPATGLPTWTSQDDLNTALYAGNGEYPRIVLAPGTPAQAYHLTQLAFNLADQGQLPIIILTDKYLSQSSYSYKQPPNLEINRGELAKEQPNYHRYAETDTGISTRSLPGTPANMYIANSDSHDSEGFSIEGDKPEHKTQIEKRLRKLATLLPKLPAPKLYGPKQADLTILAWGSSYGPIQMALQQLPDDLAKRVNFIHCQTIWPLDKAVLQTLFDNCNHLLLIENNYSGQFGKLLQAELDLNLDNKLLTYTGRQVTPTSIINQVKSIICP